jgi:hypothetical protein
MAALLGISESSLSRRVHHLITILGGRLSSRLRHPEPLSSLELKIIRIAFLDGWSFRQIACQTGLSLYRIRQIIRKLKIPDADEPDKANPLCRKAHYNDGAYRNSNVVIPRECEESDKIIDM